MSRSEAYAARNRSLRALFTSVKASAAALPPTAITIEMKAKELNVSHAVEDIPRSHGARLHWLGDRSASKLLLYFHGGGYALPPLDGHIIFPWQSIDKVSADGKKVALAFLEYTLSSEAGFPIQMIQATETLRYLLGKRYAPNDIVVAGDSAGGNLCLGLMSNLLHPYSETTPLTINEPLAGLVLISPWVSCDTDTHSYRDYGDTDVAPASLLSEMGQMFVRPDDRNSWAEPYLADASWWKNIPTKKVLNLYGDSEMFKDHISKVGKDLVAAGVDIKNVVCANHIHVECILDAQTGLEHGSMADEIWDWLKTVL